LEKETVLFLCTSNSCRSQMAEGLLRSIAADRFEAFSAGACATSVHPLAIKVMKELGVDISGQESKSADSFAGRRFDYVITVCGDAARDACPVFSGEAGLRLVWSFDDPAEAPGGEQERPATFRRVRDQIKVRLEQFVESAD